MKKNLIVLALIALVVFVGILLFMATDPGVCVCAYCGEEKECSLRLIGKVDFMVCDDCYERYLQGEWGS